MANNLSLKLIIDGTATGALRAIGQVQTATSGAESQLKRLQDAGRNALQFVGVGLGISELIQLADTYTQMTSRLKLVTQYTGDFDTVFVGLADSARATRSDLGSTVDLFTKISPSLRGIGLNGQQAVGVITTINQAIGISGASSQSAAAALLQLGQGLGAGALRGEEFNSVMENTPGLAQAIADGLGVPIGELRALANEGKLTAEVVAGALQKVAPQIEADFAKMPQTVGQALTGLKNEFMLFIGATDQATGSTSALANVIGAVAQEFKEAGPVVTALSETLRALANGFDAIYRGIKIVIVGLGAYAAAATAALAGNISEARTIWRMLGEDIESILMKPLAGEQKVADAAVDTAKKRALLQEQLKTQVEKLEAQKLYIATGSLDKVAAKEKESIDKRIGEQQRLVDAVRVAWQASLKEAETAADKAADLLDKARQKRNSTADKVTNAQMKDLSPEDQAAAAADQAQSLFDQGRYAAAASNAARLDKRFKDADKYQRQAEEFLQRAESFADKSGNTDLMQQVGDVQAGQMEAQARAKQGEAEALNKQAADQAKLLNDLQAQLEKMKADARAIEVKVELADAETKIKGLQGQLDALPANKTVTVTVNTVDAGGTMKDDPALRKAIDENGGFLPQFAFGGPLPGSAPHDRADNMMYWGTPGEWVIQRPAVRHYGAAFIAAVNAMKLPKFALGGQLGASAVNRLAIPSLPPSAGASAGKNLTLVLDGERYAAGASNDTIDRLTAFVSREALRKGGRK
ncbi:MAG TPA: tape measure protein [Azonexus sp.]|nr:tape measure protein [Azonexus sp.]